MYKSYKFGRCGKCQKKGVQNVDGQSWHCKYCGGRDEPVEHGTD